MPSTYFCAFHQEKMKVCESDAFRNWSQLMHYGVNAYVHCRTEAANIYLTAAFDIAVLRKQCELNGIFEAIHIIKPADFLIQMLTAENKYSEAIALLSQIPSMRDDEETRIFLAKHKRIIKKQIMENQQEENQNTHVTEKKQMSTNNVTTHKQVWHTHNRIHAMH